MMRVRQSFHATGFDPLRFWLEFDSKDLQANREGRLSTKQRQRIHRQQTWQTVQVMASAVGVFLVVMVTMGLKGTMPVYVQLGCFAAMIVPAALGLVWMQERIWWALNRGEVAMTQGPITLEVSDKTYYVNTPDKSLKISDSVHKALSEGMTYQLYYLSGTDYLLSAQPLAPMTKRPRTMQRRPLPIMEAPPEKQKRDEKHKHDEKPKREEKRKSSWG